MEMPRSPDKKTTKKPQKKASQKDKPSSEAKPAPRQDLPNPDSIVDEMTFTSPKGNTYRIIVTNEQDPYDEPLKPAKTRTKRGK